MDTQKSLGELDKSSHLVEVHKLWGLNYYVEVKPESNTDASKKILELREVRNPLRTNVFGGEDL